MTQGKAEICVVGAGIIGLSTAVNIIETIPSINVTLISDKFSPNTTGDGSAGIWEPYLVSGTSESKLKNWGHETFQHLAKIANSNEAGGAGTFLIGGYKLYNNKPKTLRFPYWKDTVLGFHEMSPAELSYFPDHIQYGWGYTTVVAECTKYLPWLLKRFQNHGGKVKQMRVNNLRELESRYDIIINCTGLGSRDCANDPSIHPLRGQVIRMKAPWLKMFIWMEDEGLYLLPNGETVVLGGTHDEGEWDTTPCPKAAKKIFDGCCSILPQLKMAEHVDDWVGLRPSRDGIRLDVERTNIGSKTVSIIHNYGHGGSGITLHWGCALEVTVICKNELRKPKKVHYSKL